MTAWFSLLRPVQWLKNLMIFFPPFLGGTFINVCSTPSSLLPFIAFCLVSSSTYILNDLIDRNRDLLHPDKCNRPLASGRIKPVPACLVAALLLVSGGMLSLSAPGVFRYYLAAYFLLSVAYSTGLKDIVLVDIFCVSGGFVLRLLSGGAAFHTVVSEWLFLSVFLLSVFLSMGKRLSEKMRLGDTVAHHRKTLVAYPQGFLEGSMYMTGAAVLVTYTMYVISRHSGLLLYTVPLSCFGLLQYLLRVASGRNGDPTESLTKDIPLLLVSILWAVIVGLGIYGT